MGPIGVDPGVRKRIQTTIASRYSSLGLRIGEGRLRTVSVEMAPKLI